MTPEEYKRKQVMARRLLRSYLGQSASIETIPDQIRTLELNAVSIRSATTDQTPVQGGGNKREEALNANIEARDELKRNLECAQRTVRSVKRALDTLTPHERHILETMHITHQRKATERLRREFCFSDARSVYKLERRALAHFMLALWNVQREDPFVEFFSDTPEL